MRRSQAFLFKVFLVPPIVFEMYVTLLSHSFLQGLYIEKRSCDYRTYGYNCSFRNILTNRKDNLLHHYTSYYKNFLRLALMFVVINIIICHWKLLPNEQYGGKWYESEKDHIYVIGIFNSKYLFDNCVLHFPPLCYSELHANSINTFQTLCKHVLYLIYWFDVGFSH